MFREKKRPVDLEGLGWRVLVVWECEIKATAALAGKFLAFLGGAHIVGRAML